MRALDALIPQVHGDAAGPSISSDDVELRVGDVRDADAVRRALDGVDAVVHLAARVGVGQSMYEIAEYTSANCSAPRSLLEALAERPVRKLVVASSMSIYGEGSTSTLAARGRAGGAHARAARAREWDYPGLEPVPTPERSGRGSRRSTR